METSVPRLADHNMCLLKGISVGLELGDGATALLPLGSCLCFPVPRVSAREKSPPSPFIPLTTWRHLVGLGCHHRETPEALVGPSGYLGCRLNLFPQGLKRTISPQPEVPGPGDHGRQDEPWKDSMPHCIRTFGGVARLGALGHLG